MAEYRGKHARHANPGSGAAGNGASERGFVPAAPRPSSAVPAAAAASAESAVPAKGKGNVWTIVFRVAVVVFVIALIALAAVLFMYWQGRSEYRHLADDFVVSDTKAVQLEDFTVDWDGLHKKNPEIVAWIYVPGTKINYPVAHTTDNEKYLTVTFEGSSGFVSFGTIFLDTANERDFSDANSFLYGHNMNDGSMFASIADWTDDDVFNEQRTIYLFTPGGNYRFTTFALCHVNAYEEIVRGTFSDDADYLAYLKDKLDRSVVTADPAVPDLANVTKSIALSTCDNVSSDGRYIAFAYLADSTNPDFVGLEQFVNVSTATPSDVAAVQDAAA